MAQGTVKRTRHTGDGTLEDRTSFVLASRQDGTGTLVDVSRSPGTPTEWFAVVYTALLENVPFARDLDASTESAASTWPGVQHTGGVVGGQARVPGTRVPVWVLESYRQLGLTDADILRQYPRLSARNLVDAWAYVASHRDEIDHAIALNQ